MRLLKKMRMEALYSQKEFAQVIGSKMESVDHLLK